MIVVDNKFEIGQIVYSKTDKDQLARIVTGICHRSGHILYEVACGTGGAWFNDYELSAEKNVLITTNN